MTDQNKGQLKFYKGSGALQCRVIPPRFTDKGFLDKEGALLLEAAPSSGKQQWDWSKKVTFAVGVADIAAIFNNNEKVDIFHSADSVPKKLIVEPGQQSGWFLTLAAGQKESRLSVRVPLTDGEWEILKSVMKTLVPTLCGLT